MAQVDNVDNASMDQIYGQTIACECGKTHHIEPRRVIYERAALTRLHEALSECTTARRVAILMDSRTRDVVGETAAAMLRDYDWHVLEVVVPDPAKGPGPVCDDHTHDMLLCQMEAPDVILPVGSGVLSDLGKWIASDLNVPHVCFATAASMNGYASANVAATIKGVKSLLRGHPPKLVLSDPTILRDAPYAMTAAGLGDVLGKSVSSADWWMNHFLFGDYHCERSVSLIADLEPLYMNHPEDLRDRKPEAIAALFHSLLLTGVAMTMAESSAPASGGEHLVSHALDMMSFLDETDHDLHGSQVGIGTVLASEIYRRVLSIESPEFHTPVSVDKGFWRALGDEIEAHYTAKIERLQKAAEMLSQGDVWDRLREEVKPLLRSPDEIRGCLQRAGAAFRAEHIGCSRERLLCALLHAHEIRSRFTIIDLARLVGLLPQAAEEIVEEWS